MIKNLDFPNPANGVNGPIVQPNNDHGPTSSLQFLNTVGILERFQIKIIEQIPTDKSNAIAIEALSSIISAENPLIKKPPY